MVYSSFKNLSGWSGTDETGGTEVGVGMRVEVEVDILEATLKDWAGRGERIGGGASV